MLFIFLATPVISNEKYMLQNFQMCSILMQYLICHILYVILCSYTFFPCVLAFFNLHLFLFSVFSKLNQQLNRDGEVRASLRVLKIRLKKSLFKIISKYMVQFFYPCLTASINVNVKIILIGPRQFLVHNTITLCWKSGIGSLHPALFLSTNKMSLGEG